MARFNTPDSTVIQNNAGGIAYAAQPHEELYMAVCTSILEDKAYESGSVRLKRIKELVQQCDPIFVRNLAIYVRENMYLRTIAHVLAVELAHTHKGVAKLAVQRVCQRPDDMTEIIAYHISNYGRTIPHQIKKGIAAAFPKFSAFQLAKYNRDGKVTLKDVAFMTHPTPNDAIHALILDKLHTPETWETKLSATHGENKDVAWSSLVMENNLGYMALLRNLRNIIENCGNDREIMERVRDTLADQEKVSKAKQLPFRFFSAYREILQMRSHSPYTGIILDAIERAAALSVKNLRVEGVTMIAADVSGSMDTLVSQKSKVRLKEIACLMAGLAREISPTSISSLFATDLAIVQVPNGRIFQLLRGAPMLGGSTNGHLVPDYLRQKNISVDNIFIFTDMQMYNSGYGKETFANTLEKYRRDVNPNVKTYIFDLSGYGQFVSNAPNVYTISGWSDNVFKVIEHIENKRTIIHKIENLVL